MRSPTFDSGMFSLCSFTRFPWTKAIAMFNSGDGGFKDLDLYPFCFNISDGAAVAGPERVRGKDVRTLKDPSGNAYGADLYKAAQEGKITEVSYVFPKPGETTPSPKVSFVTGVGDLGCGVGYYK
jgi:signal transduction histidine kinase